MKERDSAQRENEQQHFPTLTCSFDSLLPLTAEIATLSYHHDFQDDLTACVWVPCVWTSKAAVHRPIILPPCHHGNILAAQEA